MPYISASLVSAMEPFGLPPHPPQAVPLPLGGEGFGLRVIWKRLQPPQPVLPLTGPLRPSSMGKEKPGEDFDFFPRIFV